MITDFRLKVFKTVADRLSFTKAAAELLISQPAVTRHISELEKQLGVPLFDRCRGNVSLTAHGKLMLDYANRILAIYADLNDTFADDAGRPAGNIRIGASTTSCRASSLRSGDVIRKSTWNWPTAIPNR